MDLSGRVAPGEPTVGRMSDWDPVRAWTFIRASKAYRAAWRRQRLQPGLLEPGPFEVRWQTAADAGALCWGLYAWANPDAADGPTSPFWVGAPMFEGRIERDAAPLTALAAAGEAALAGLRVGGDLILKIEQDGMAVQVRIADGGPFPADGGLQLVRKVVRIEDVWSGVPGPGPGSGRGRGTMTRNCCSCWPARPRACRNERSRRRSGGGTRSPRSTSPAAGCSRGSGAG